MASRLRASDNGTATKVKLFGRGQRSIHDALGGGKGIMNPSTLNLLVRENMYYFRTLDANSTQLAQNSWTLAKYTYPMVLV